jgi:hypothetical protein
MSTLEPASPAAPSRNEAPQPTPQVENPEPFSFDTVLWRGFGLYARFFLPLTALTLLLLAPWLVANAASAGDTNAGQMTSLGWLAMALSMISVPLASAAAVCAVADVVRGRPIRVGASLRAMLPHAAPVVGAAILTSFSIAFAMLACIVPGLIVLAMLYVTMPAMLIERCSIVDACKRSIELTKGHRFATFFLALSPMVINVSAGAALGGHVPLAVSTGITSLVGVMTGALGAIVATISYIDLRNEKEPGFKGQALDDALASLTQR